MSHSTASACEREPALVRGFVVGNLAGVEREGPDFGDDVPFPSLVHDLDDRELDFGGICAWLDTSKDTRHVVSEPVSETNSPDETPDLETEDDEFRDFLQDVFREEAHLTKRAAETSFFAPLSSDSSGDKTLKRPREDGDTEDGDTTSPDDDKYKDDDKSPDDDKSVRLKRNRLSAAASRERKKNEIFSLKRRVRDLERANQHLSYATQCLGAENTAMRMRLGFQPGLETAPDKGAFPDTEKSKNGAGVTGKQSRLDLQKQKNTRALSVTEPAALDLIKTGSFMHVDLFHRETRSTASPRVCVFSFELFRRDFRFAPRKRERNRATRRARR